uniref:Uncharacterized protein n=1 Tax=Arundo donax TaxID=35708 RepID=A0A0A9AUE7_ARUDO
MGSFLDSRRFSLSVLWTKPPPLLFQHLPQELSPSTSLHPLGKVVPKWIYLFL